MNAIILVSDVRSNGIYISTNPVLTVFDGLEDEDIDFQSDISSISGRVGTNIIRSMSFHDL